MPPLFPIIWYVSLEQRMPEGEEGGWGPCCNAQRHGEHGHYRSATTGCTVAASLCNHLLLAGMFVLPSYLQGMGRGAMARSTPPLQFSVLLAAPAGLPVFPCLHFPSCPPGMPQAATSVTDCPTAAAHDTGSAHPLALASTPAFFPWSYWRPQLWRFCSQWAVPVNEMSGEKKCGKQRREGTMNKFIICCGLCRSKIAALHLSIR